MICLLGSDPPVDGSEPLAPPPMPAVVLPSQVIWQAVFPGTTARDYRSATMRARPTGRATAATAAECRCQYGTG